MKWIERDRERLGHGHISSLSSLFSLYLVFGIFLLSLHHSNPQVYNGEMILFLFHFICGCDFSVQNKSLSFFLYVSGGEVFFLFCLCFSSSFATLTLVVSVMSVVSVHHRSAAVHRVQLRARGLHRCGMWRQPAVGRTHPAGLPCR